MLRLNASVAIRAKVKLETRLKGHQDTCDDRGEVGHSRAHTEEPPLNPFRANTGPWHGEALHIQMTLLEERFNQDEWMELPGFWTTSDEEPGREEQWPLMMCILIVSSYKEWCLFIILAWWWPNHSIRTSAEVFQVGNREPSFHVCGDTSENTANICARSHF